MRSHRLHREFDVEPVKHGICNFAGMSTAAAVVLGSIGSAVVGSLLQDTPSVPAAPTPEKPTAMPDPLAQQKQAKRKAALMQSQQMTRASTVLTGDQDTLGG